MSGLSAAYLWWAADRVISETLVSVSVLWAASAILIWRCCWQFAIEVIRGPKLQKLSAEVSKPVSLTVLSSFAPVIEFLQGAGQNQLISQVASLIIDLMC